MTIARHPFPKLRTVLALMLSALLAGCAAPRPADYAGERPTLSLRDYFSGRVQGHGMFQDWAGKVLKRFTVTMDCRWNGDTGVLDESFRYSDGSTQRRVWTLRALGNGRFTGTADDVVGTAEGQQRGNAFQWNYTLRLDIGSDDDVRPPNAEAPRHDPTLVDVQMDDWMFLIDQKVMLNRAEMRKFGIRVGEVTLAFTRP